MKAARLYEVGTALKVEEVAEPDLKPGRQKISISANFFTLTADIIALSNRGLYHET